MLVGRQYRRCRVTDDCDRGGGGRGVAGIGTKAAIESLMQPCRGFHALFNLSDGQCVNGHYVGYLPLR
jgi:hypothetical protein